MMLGVAPGPQNIKGMICAVTEGDVVWTPDDSVHVVLRNYDGSFWLHQLYPPVPVGTHPRKIPAYGGEPLLEILGTADLEDEGLLHYAALYKEGSWREVASRSTTASSMFHNLSTSGDPGDEDNMSIDCGFSYDNDLQNLEKIFNMSQGIVFEFYYPNEPLEEGATEPKLYYGYRLGTFKFYHDDDGNIDILKETNEHVGGMVGNTNSPIYPVSCTPTGGFTSSWIRENIEDHEIWAITKIWGIGDTPPMRRFLEAKLRELNAGSTDLPLIWSKDYGINFK